MPGTQAEHRERCNSTLDNVWQPRARGGNEHRWAQVRDESTLGPNHESEPTTVHGKFLPQLSGRSKTTRLWRRSLKNEHAAKLLSLPWVCSSTALLVAHRTQKHCTPDLGPLLLRRCGPEETLVGSQRHRRCEGLDCRLPDNFCRI